MAASQDDTPLMAAARVGDTDSVLRLVRDAGADVAEAKARDGATALFLAAQGGHKETLAALLHQCDAPCNQGGHCASCALGGVRGCV